MLKKDTFIDGIWNKYNSYNNTYTKKDKFFTQHVYKNSEYLLVLKTFSTFLLIIILSVGITYAGMNSYKFTQTFTNTDFKKNVNYDYQQDMIYQNGIYYKKITTYDDYNICKNRWNNLGEMSKEDFNENFMIVIADENYSTIGLKITDIYTDDSTVYIQLKQIKSDTKHTVISTIISNELDRKNILIKIVPEVPNVSKSQYIKLEDLPKIYKKENAIKDNCFVVENNKIISNDINQLNDFIEKAKDDSNISIRIAIFYNDNLTIIDLEYKDNIFIMCEDNTRNNNEQKYYHTGNKITVTPISSSEKIYWLEDEYDNKFPICGIKSKF